MGSIIIFHLRKPWKVEFFTRPHRTRCFPARPVSEWSNTVSRHTVNISLLPKVINMKFPLQLHQKYYIPAWRTWLHVDERRLYATNYHYVTYTFLFKGCENVLFELANRKGLRPSYQQLATPHCCVASCWRIAQCNRVARQFATPVFRCAQLAPSRKQFYFSQ